MSAEQEDDRGLADAGREWRYEGFGWIATVYRFGVYVTMGNGGALHAARRFMLAQDAAGGPLYASVIIDGATIELGRVTRKVPL